MSDELPWGQRSRRVRERSEPRPELEPVWAFNVAIVPVYIQYTATEGHLLILFYLKHGEFQLSVLKVGFLGVQEQINSLHYFLLGK